MGHRIAHKSWHRNASSVAKAIHKDGDVVHALPEGARARLAVRFAPEEAAALCDQPHNRVQRGNLLGNGC